MQADRRLNVKRFFAGDEGQRLLRWTQRDPGRADLVLQPVHARDGKAPERGRDSQPVDDPVRAAALPLPLAQDAQKGRHPAQSASDGWRLRAHGIYLSNSIFLVCVKRFATSR